MARIRTIKPEFFRHEQLFEAEKESGLPLRLAFAGLWTAADREGRFRWSPRALKLDCLPYDDVDFGAVLDALARYGFVVKYQDSDGGVEYGAIPSWDKHQVINNRESDSQLPPPPVGAANGTRATSASPTSTGFVYVAIAASAQMAKIGFALRNPLDRIHDLSCGSPEELELFGYFEGTQADEASLRNALKEHHSRREWFKWTASLRSELDAWVVDNQRVTHAWGTRDPLCKGEGKGREGERKEEDAAPNGAHSPSEEVPPVVPETTEFYRRLKQVIGPSSGGLGKKLLAAKGGNVALARAALETASTMAEPREYIGAIIRGRERDQTQEAMRLRGDAW
jgi:hypothetical protein